MRNWGRKILKKFTNPDFYEEVSGDLDELYSKEQSGNSFLPGLKYLWRSMESVISYSRNNRRNISPKYAPMLRNYILIAIRSLTRQMGYTTINLFGLAIGLASAVLITLFIWNETGYDTFHSKSKNIYRITKKLKGGVEENLGTVPFPLAYSLQEEFGKIKAVKFLREIEPVMKVGENVNIEPRFFFADPEIFDIFDFKVAGGDGKEILSDPNSIILSKSAAERYFGSQDPIGEQIALRKWSRETKYTVGGVLEEIPPKSHISFDFLVKYDSPTNLWKGMHGEDWYFAGGAYTYVLFENQRDVQTLREFFPDFVKSHFPVSVRDKVELDVQPLESIHLHSKLDNELEPNGDISTNWILGIIGALILIVACINFTNLATARYTVRAKEVGIRKVMGAQRNQLVTQFLGEAIIINFLSLLISLVIVWAALPYFNSIIDKPIQLTELGWSNLKLPLLILMTGLTAGILSGAYPAVFLSSFNPVDAFKSGKGKADKGGVRKLLVIFQFSISMILLVSLFIITDQISFMKSKNLGFDSRRVVLIDGSNITMPGRTGFRNALKQHSSVDLVSGGWMAPGTVDFQPSLGLFAISGMESPMQMATARVDPQFFELYKIELLTGREFILDDDATNSIILNESAAKVLENNGQSVMGAEMSLYDMLGNLQGKRTVIGIVKDFNFESLHNPIKPLVIGMHSNPGFISARINSNDALEFIRKEWKNQFPEVPLILSHINDQTQSFYKKEENLAGLMKGFSAIALFIGSLGLFSLASFTTERRSKEIGIRKVMGASKSQILTMIFYDFRTIILVGLLFSIPVAYFAMDYWLQNFAYKVEIGALNFVISALIAVCVLGVSVTHRSWLAASVNPVDTLKNE